MPGIFGRKRLPEPPIEPVAREELLARLGGALEHREPVAPVVEVVSKRTPAPAAGQTWRRALRGDEPAR